MLIYVYIAVGGALGALSRYGMQRAVMVYLPNLAFPLSTFLTNVIGSFLLGLVYALISDRLDSLANHAPLVTVGFLGAFTTFSTFMLDTINLVYEGKIGTAVLYLGISIILGLFAAWLGIIIGRLI